MGGIIILIEEVEPELEPLLIEAEAEVAEVVNEAEVVGKQAYDATAASLAAAAKVASDIWDSIQEKPATSPTEPTPCPSAPAAAGGGDGGGGNGRNRKPKLVRNPKHHPNARGDASPEPSDAEEVFKNAIEGPDGCWYGKNAQGEIYRFSRPSNGETHWNGSSSGPNAIRPNNIPASVKRSLGVELK